MDYSIKSNEDIQYFYEKTNCLHDGYIVGVQYENNGISKTEHGHSFDFERTKLVLKILVTSIWDAVVELEFENLLSWQIKGNQWGMLGTTVMFDEHNLLVWSDDIYINMDELKKGTHAIAKSMRWRITES